jgi:hypothetical protein
MTETESSSQDTAIIQEKIHDSASQRLWKYASSSEKPPSISSEKDTLKTCWHAICMG